MSSLPTGLSPTRTSINNIGGKNAVRGALSQKKQPNHRSTNETIAFTELLFLDPTDTMVGFCAPSLSEDDPTP
jgi:hypothetical protein